MDPVLNHPLFQAMQKSERLVIGLMSGTSADGIDAVLVRIHGSFLRTRVEQLAFITLPFTAQARDRILAVAGGSFGGSHELCNLNFYLGTLFADACETLCQAAGISPAQIDLVGTHGQTVYHIPQPEQYLDRSLTSTLQIGEPSVIAQRLGCPVVSDFRVRDMAAGGLGAPLVPYTEYLLYRSETAHVALQNIGGIGNITMLPKDCSLADVYAFDTGPGNMVMDALTDRLTKGKATYDVSGLLAAAGTVSQPLLAYMLQDDYLLKAPPKTTGRERYGRDYVDALCQKAQSLGVSLQDTLSTATRFTAECIRLAIADYCHPAPDRLIIGGGGSQNPTLFGHIRTLLPHCEVLTNEDLQLDSNSKEAVAFAILANEALFAIPNNAIGATGAANPVVMGKISL